MIPFEVDGQPFEAPEGIQTEEELFDYIDKGRQAERNALVDIYESVRAEIEADYSVRMARITGTWGHWLGFNKMEDAKRDASEVRERVLRSERENHERALRNLEQRHTNYILSIWSGIRTAREKIHLERLSATSRCYLLETECEMAVTKCVPTPTGCHHPPTICITYNNGSETIQIPIPENLALLPNLDEYLNEVYKSERAEVRKATAERRRNYRYYGRLDLEQYDWLQCQTKIALLGVEERFCAERLREWRQSEEYRREAQMLAERVKARTEEILKRFERERLERDARERAARGMGEDIRTMKHFWTIDFYPEEDENGEESNAYRQEGEIEEGAGRPEVAVCNGDDDSEEGDWVERARGVARIDLNARAPQRYFR